MKPSLLPLVLLCTVLVAVGLAYVFVHRYMPWADIGAARAATPRAAETAVRTAHTVADFSALDVQGFCEVTLRSGSTPAVVVDAPAELQAGVEIAVRGSTLGIDCRTPSRGVGAWFSRGPSKPPRIDVTFVRLEAVAASGAVMLHAGHLASPALAFDLSGAANVDFADLATDNLSIDGSGAVKIEIAGRARAQHIEISGAGDYQARDLVSETASVEVSGAGKVVVNATRTLHIELSGAGIVDYVGTPEVHQSISGLGRVRQLDRRAADDKTPAVPHLPFSSAPVA
ncbi:MAG: DUF2807 domain-containing protein [Proteobacteria bacterium]|nr:DUF2807 domain-containing protein [Pseudomonadota bacterium]